MPATFQDIFKSSFLERMDSVSLPDTVAALLLAFLLGLFIFLVYKRSYCGVMYSASFGVTLIALTLITTLLILAVTSNVILSLGMVGALSIVRFRTAIKDSRDTTYIFWAIIVGICCGVGDYLVAGVGTAVVFVVLLFLGRVRNENRVLLIIRGAKNRCMEMEGMVFSFFGGKALLKVKNTTAESAELIFEMPRSTYQITYKKDQDIVDKLYDLGGVEYVNIVTQSDEITG